MPLRDLLQYAEWTGVGGIALNFLACVFGFLSLEVAARLGLKLLTGWLRLATAGAGWLSQSIAHQRAGCFVLVLLVLPDVPKQNPHAGTPAWRGRTLMTNRSWHASGRVLWEKPMNSILRQLAVTAAFLGGWVVLLLILFLCGIPLPHTHAFAGIGRLVGYDPYPRDIPNRSPVAPAARRGQSGCGLAHLVSA